MKQQTIIVSFHACLIVYDDGEEEKVDLPDDTVKVFDGMHECAGDLL